MYVLLIIYIYSWYHDLSTQISYPWFMVFKYENVLNSIIVKYMYCKSLKWVVDGMNIDEHGFIRAWLWMKGFYGILRFWLHRTLCVIECPRLEYGCCVLCLRGGSHLQRPLFPDIDWNWELRATPLWREPPLESQFYWGMGAACYAFVREPPPESLSLYVSPLGARHSSHMPLGRVYGVHEMMAFGADY